MLAVVRSSNLIAQNSLAIVVSRFFKDQHLLCSLIFLVDLQESMKDLPERMKDLQERMKDLQERTIQYGLMIVAVGVVFGVCIGRISLR